MQKIAQNNNNISSLLNTIRNIKKDPFITPDGFRPTRCTGAAVSFALSLLENSFSGSPAKTVLFTQGSCTFGPGQTQNAEISSEERISLTKAQSFYEGLAERMNHAGHSIDIFAETVADIGYEQLKPLITYTGGAIVFAQDFEERIVINSINKLYGVSDSGSSMGGVSEGGISNNSNMSNNYSVILNISYIISLYLISFVR